MNCKEVIADSLKQADADIKGKIKAAELIDNAMPCVCCEATTVSDHSVLGPVDNSEYLARLLFSPQHIDEDGNIIPVAFNDASNKGLSVQRAPTSECHPDWEVIGDAIAVDQANTKKKPVAYIGAIVALCADVRSITHPDVDGQPSLRSFGVYDTAKHDNSDHSDVMQVYQKAGRSLRGELRDTLASKFSINYLKPQTT